MRLFLVKKKRHGCFHNKDQRRTAHKSANTHKHHDGEVHKP